MSNKLLPESYKRELTTVWSFPERGNWATHNAKYRGNFAPQVARNLIEFYTKEKEFVLDPMVGSGTTLIEAKLLNRHALGIDINPEAVELSNKALDFDYKNTTKQKAILGNAKELFKVKMKPPDLIIFHPPYLDIVEYSKGKIKDDLSNISNIELFCNEIELIANQLYSLLKPDKYCALLIGDTRKAQHYVPLSHYVLQRFLNAGFILKEEIIKQQHNCVFSNRWVSSAKKFGFYLIMHEHLFVFRKPKEDEKLSKFKWSMKLNGKS
jgi:DNA modification methylase